MIMRKNIKLQIIFILGIVLILVGTLLIDFDCRFSTTYLGENHSISQRICPYEEMGVLSLIIGGILVAFTILVFFLKSLKFFLKD